MESLGYATKVGAAVVVFAILFVVGWIFIKGSTISHEHYRINIIFDDASNIEKGVDVTMSGVKVGEVESVTLKGLKADAELSIYKGTLIPQGSQFLIEVPTFGDEGTINITPPPPSPAMTYVRPHQGGLVGGRVGDMQSAIDNANDLMNKFGVTISKVNHLLDQSSAIVGDPAMQSGLKDAIVNLQQASKNGLVLTTQLQSVLREDNGQVASMLQDMHTGTHTAVKNIDATTADIAGMASENRSSIDEIVQNMRDTSAALEGITSEANDMLKNGGVSKNLSSIVANLNSATEKMDTIAANMEKVTGDPGMQTDLKQTVHNLNETTQQTDYLVTRINHIVGTKQSPTAGPSTTSPQPSHGHAGAVPLILPRVDFLQNAREHHFRMDMDAVVPVGRQDFAEGGIFGVTEGNRLDLEYGTLPFAASRVDVRGGLHDSDLAVGGDYWLGGPYSLSADLYDPNYGHLNVHGTVMLNPNIGLVIGGDDLTHSASSAVVGVELRR